MNATQPNSQYGLPSSKGLCGPAHCEIAAHLERNLLDGAGPNRLASFWLQKPNPSWRSRQHRLEDESNGRPCIEGCQWVESGWGFSKYETLTTRIVLRDKLSAPSNSNTGSGHVIGEVLCLWLPDDSEKVCCFVRQRTELRAACGYSIKTG